jgi:sugar phosphate permease
MNIVFFSFLFSINGLL